VGYQAKGAQVDSQLDVWLFGFRWVSFLCQAIGGIDNLQGSRDLDANQGACGRTFSGRKSLRNHSLLETNRPYGQVVYGDTDSVFVNSNVTDYQEAIKIANDFKRHVNDRYRLLEIDLDNVFARVLLLQKKKYAAVKISEDGTAKTEIKGLDMVRREYCKLSKNVSK
jgi:DNA polymerase elongation subunit (family B)